MLELDHFQRATLLKRGLHGGLSASRNRKILESEVLNACLHDIVLGQRYHVSSTLQGEQGGLISLALSNQTVVTVSYILSPWNQVASQAAIIHRLLPGLHFSGLRPQIIKFDLYVTDLILSRAISD